MSLKLRAKKNQAYSTQIDFARKNSSCLTSKPKKSLKLKKAHKSKPWPFKLHAAGLAAVGALWLSYFLIPSEMEEMESSFTYNEQVDAFVNLAKQDHYLTGPVPMAPVDDMHAKIMKAQMKSPILAANMATTRYYGPQEESFMFPDGKVTEVTVKAGDTLGTIFNRVGVGSTTMHKLLKEDLAGAQLQKIYPGQTLTFVTDETGLKQIRYPHSAHETFVINNSDEGVDVDIIALPREVRKNYASATINDSLYVAAKEAHIDNQIIMQMAEIFAYDIDFYLDIKRGDSFKVLYEEYYVDGEKVGNGPILAAEFVNQGKEYQIVRYTDKNGGTQYYSSDGTSLRKAFLRSPVEYARISSHFNLARKHPILHKIRAHKGVDYAAPRGTPIVASGNGKIVQLGRRGAYGNMVEIQHNGPYRTLYAHMNGFAKNLKVGSRVEQGQVIGYVGNTGLASGPHLHYEFKVNGVQKDPVKIDLPMSEPLPKQEKSQFLLHASNMFNEIKEFDQILLAYQSNDKSQSQG